MFAKERAVLLPGLSEIFVERAVQREEHFARFSDDVVGPIDAKPDHENQHDRHWNAHGGMSGQDGAHEGCASRQRQRMKRHSLMIVIRRRDRRWRGNEGWSGETWGKSSRKIRGGLFEFEM
jgi:hypothetical protein